uniref:Metalloendopeptidase n=1 Tax=Ascaris lumbricoides TaxID=6252 RepID=A0A0M3HHL0_ASCLU
HALGLYHEQARYDRDSHVRVLTQNIQSGYANQFSKQSQNSMVTYGVKYDYGSVMHYPSDGFSANGRDTLEALDPNYQSTIGQRTGLSFSDAKKVNLAYCNGTCYHRLQCQYGGYTDPKDCSRCRCTEGLGGTLCGEPLQTSKNCGTLSLTATSSFKTLSQSGTGSCNFMITACLL